MSTAPSARIRVGVIGLGFGERVLVPAFRADSRCEVAAVAATRLDRAQEAAQRLGVPTAYGDWRTLLDDASLHAVAVAVPPPAQPEIALAALQRRKHLFCEKPLATTPEAAATLLSAAREARVAHMVDFEFSAIEVWQRAKTLIEGGVLGRLRHAVIGWQMETYATRVQGASWKRVPDEGGGVLNLFGSHVLAYLEWLLGPIQQLTARLEPAGHLGSGARDETTALLWAILTDGAPVSITISAGAFLGTGHRVEMYGEQGSLMLDNPTTDYVRGFRLLQGLRGDHAMQPVTVPQVRSLPGDGRIGAVAGLVSRFLDGIERGVPVPPTFEEGYRVQCLVAAARKAHATQTWIDVTPQLAATSLA